MHYTLRVCVVSSMACVDIVRSQLRSIIDSTPCTKLTYFCKYSLDPLAYLISDEHKWPLVVRQLSVLLQSVSRPPSFMVELGVAAVFILGVAMRRLIAVGGISEVHL